MKLSDKITADRVGGLIWVVFGAAIIYGSWMMDRLTQLQIHPATAPGLVPALLGAGIAALGLILMLRSEATSTGDFSVAAEKDAAAGIDATDEAPIEDGLALKRVLLSWALCITYGGLLLGRSAPYWVLTVAFLFLHINLIDETNNVPAKLDKRRALIAAILAVAFATAVALIFEKIFLVRLP